MLCTYLILIFIVGWHLDWKICLILTALPLAITALGIAVRESYFMPFLLLDLNNTVYVIAQVVMVAIPYILLVYSMIVMSSISVLLKVLILGIYLFCIPFIAYYEDESASRDIFEIAELTWNKF